MCHLSHCVTTDTGNVSLSYLLVTAILSLTSDLWNQIWCSARDMQRCINPIKPPCAWPTWGRTGSNILLTNHGKIVRTAGPAHLNVL